MAATTPFELGALERRREGEAATEALHRRPAARPSLQEDSKWTEGSGRREGSRRMESSMRESSDRFRLFRPVVAPAGCCSVIFRFSFTAGAGIVV